MLPKMRSSPTGTRSLTSTLQNFVFDSDTPWVNLDYLDIQPRQHGIKARATSRDLRLRVSVFESIEKGFRANRLDFLHLPVSNDLLLSSNVRSYPSSKDMM